MATYSDKYLSILKEYEGFYARPYLCPAQKCTIGYGTNLEAHRKFIPYADIREGKLTGNALRKALINRGMEWSKETAEKAMREELDATLNSLMRRVSAYGQLCHRGEQARSEVILDMAYNMGVATLLTFRNTLSFIERGEYQKAATNMRASRWYGQVGRRARTDIYCMENGAWPNNVLK